MKLPIVVKNKILPILSGTEIGIPINIISKVSSDVNFLNSPISKESIILNFLLGFATYKQDRYLDAVEYFSIYNVSDIELINKKHDYYLSLIDNEKSVQFTLFCSYIAICIFSVYYHIGCIIPLFSTTFTYKYFKQNKNVSFLKPFYVAGMWTFCTCIIPLLINEVNNVNELMSINQFNNYLNLDFFNSISPTFLNLFALTNLADLKDYDEDIFNDINTLPIILGPLKTKGIVLLSCILSTIMFMTSPYYENNIQNMVYISSNIFPYISFFNNFTNVTN